MKIIETELYIDKQWLSTPYANFQFSKQSFMTKKNEICFEFNLHILKYCLSYYVAVEI